MLVIDDGSTDCTSELLKGRDFGSRVEVINHPTNAGKGAAIRSGLAVAKGKYTAIFDADLEYEPADLADLGFSSQTSYSFWYVVGNKFVTMATNVLYNCWISDVMTCHKVLPTELFRSLDLRESGFAIEAEIAARLLRTGVRIYEVPVSYRARQRDEGKKLTTVDGLRVVRTPVRCRIR